ncbi:MAG: hypothetical protein PHX47_03660 [Candidatus ainarchaeum sp.]|jgi:hypothetical protein|nr:hypothetical protein [Candidatus ainarchaeum sp.]
MFSNMLFAAVDSTNMTASPEALGGIIAIFAGLALLANLINLAIYVYTALAFQTIGKKLKYKYPWLSWIPVANIAMILELGGFHWALIFLVLIPILGWFALLILYIVSLWRIFEKRNYPGWLALIPVVSLVVIGMAAWKDR